MAEIIRLNAKTESVARRLAGGNGADYAIEVPTTPAFLKRLYREAKAAGIFYAD